MLNAGKMGVARCDWLYHGHLDYPSCIEEMAGDSYGISPVPSLQEYRPGWHWNHMEDPEATQNKTWDH